MPKDFENFLRDKVNPIIIKLLGSVLTEEDFPIISNEIRIWMGADRIRSGLLAEYHEKSEDVPNGCILLHIDAIINYAKHIEMPFLTVLAFNLFERVYFMTIDNGTNLIEITQDIVIKSHDYATECCSILYDLGILRELPVDNIKDTLAGKTYLSWIKNWTKMNPEDWFKLLAERGEQKND